MKSVAEDLIKIEFEKHYTLQQCIDLFVDIMDKYDIEQCYKTDAGMICDNFEWTMAKALFMQELVEFFEWKFIEEQD